MQHLEVSGAVRHIYIYIYVIRRLKVNVHHPFVFYLSYISNETRDDGLTHHSKTSCCSCDV